MKRGQSPGLKERTKAPRGVENRRQAAEHVSRAWPLPPTQIQSPGAGQGPPGKGQSRGAGTLFTSRNLGRKWCHRGPVPTWGGLSRALPTVGRSDGVCHGSLPLSPFPSPSVDYGGRFLSARSAL